MDQNLQINNIIFFNYWRNGDSFINREYVKDIIKHFAGVQFMYAHDNPESILRDIPVIQGPTSILPKELTTWIPYAYNAQEATLYINAWIGVHTGEHANFVTLHNAWAKIFQEFNVPLRDWEMYHPETNFEFYDLTEANNYLNKIQNKPMVLICNGQQQSNQSAMGPMANTLNFLAQSFPDHEFLVTAKVGVTNHNITYTDDLFLGPVGNLQQIAYLSKRAKVIVGKNSGPFSFSHIKENMNDWTKTFICFGYQSKHCLMGAGKYLCNSIFSSTVDEHIAGLLIKEYIDNPGSINQLKETVVR